MPIGEATRHDLQAIVEQASWKTWLKIAGAIGLLGGSNLSTGFITSATVETTLQEQVKAQAIIIDKQQEFNHRALQLLAECHE